MALKKGKPVEQQILPETWAAALAVILSCVFINLDWSWWHPGLCFSNEIQIPEQIQGWGSGWGLVPRLGGGFPLLCLQKLFSLVPGTGLTALHLPVQLMLLVEFGLLFWLGRRLAGERAGSWAVLAASLAAFTWLRGRNVLSYTLLPGELLGMLAWILLCRSRASACLAGLVSGLLCLDYEGWLLALPVLLLAWIFEPTAKRKLLPFWGLGAAAGLGAVVAFQWPWFAGYLVQRRALTLPGGVAQALGSFGIHLRSFWLGGPAIPNLGLENHPVFPVWAWPGLAAGAWLAARRKPWLLAWAVLGMLPLALRANALEPNRLGAAWPALCLLAGWGMAALLDQARRRRLGKKIPLLCLGLVAAALAWEGLSYASVMAQKDGFLYGYSRGLLRAGREIHRNFHTGQVALLTGLDTQPCQALRYFARLPPRPLGRFTLKVALVPWHFAGKLDDSWGRLSLVPTSEGMAPLYLLYTSKKAAPRLMRVDGVISDLQRRAQVLPLTSQQEIWRGALANPDNKDPWIRTICWENLLDRLAETGKAWDQELAGAEKEKLESVSLLKKAAYRLQDTDPQKALRLITRATQEDGRSIQAWIFRLDLLKRLGKDKEAAALLKHLRRTHAAFATSPLSP